MNSRRRGRAPGKELRHPMLLHGAGIATIAAACTSAANALTLSAVMLVLCCGMATIYIFERGEYRPPMLGVLYFVSAAFIVCILGKILILLSETTAESIGMYLPLAAADALVLARLQPDAPFVSPSDALVALRDDGCSDRNAARNIWQRHAAGRAALLPGECGRDGASLCGIHPAGIRAGHLQPLCPGVAADA